MWRRKIENDNIDDNDNKIVFHFCIAEKIATFERINKGYAKFFRFGHKISERRRTAAGIGFGR